jgi:hypothetical protein
MSAFPNRSSTSRFDQTFLSAAYVRKSTPCRACRHAILPLHVKIGLVRRINTSRFPCQKAHWYHPLCLPPAEVNILNRYGSMDGVPKEDTDIVSCVKVNDLSDNHRELIKALLAHTLPTSQLPAEFTEMGKVMHNRAGKRKRADDEAYIPRSERPAPPSAKRRFSGACRAAVQDSIASFKAKVFQEQADAMGFVRCALSGVQVSQIEAHVDHAPPNTFDVLVQGFLAENAAKHGTTPVYILSNTEFVAGRFFDQTEIEAFLEYHTANASLRVLTACTNLSLPRKRQC